MRNLLLRVQFPGPLRGEKTNHHNPSNIAQTGAVCELRAGPVKDQFKASFTL
jgi:hypothetical protein